MEICTELILCKALLGGMTWLLVDNVWIADGKFTDVAPKSKYFHASASAL
jgi:hypothetical protein